MKTYTSVVSVPPVGRSAAGRRPLRARFAAWRTEHRRRALVAHELARLDENELTDLGISRADFPTIIRGTYHR